MTHTDKTSLILAAINCPHTIDEKRVTLEFDPSKPGHNALNQLGLRLDAARAALSAQATGSVQASSHTAGPDDKDTEAA